MEENQRLILNSIYLVLIVVGVLLTLVRMGIRLVSFIRAGQTIPALLPRDVVLFAGLASLVVMIIAARVIPGLSEAVMGQLWWIVLTSTPPTAGIYYWLYYELFKIER